MEHQKKKIKIVLSMGDPAGIGTEICLKAITKKKWSGVQFVLVGKAESILTTSKSLKVKSFPVLGSEQLSNFNNHCILDIRALQSFKIGKISKSAGLIAFKSLEIATNLMLTGKYQALVTAPIHKQSILKAGFEFEGHTEYLEHKSKAKKVVMLLSGGGLNTALVTRHVPYKSVPSMLTKKEIIEVTEIVHKSFSKIKKNPTIGILGLNPHASDGGRFGDEEKLIIMPAIKELQKRHPNIQGPYPPDTAFHLALKQKWDAEICMYHDQGLIPLKTLAFDSGVNITLGLPFVRTSPDHGTAFDIAGKNIANESSMVCAIQKAIEWNSLHSKTKGS